MTGGAGAVGHYAVQLATWAGARVIATVGSPEKGVYCQSLGADVVLNYRSPTLDAEIISCANGNAAGKSKTTALSSG